MNDTSRRSGFHSSERMRQLKLHALPTRDEHPAPTDGFTRRGVIKAFLGASTALALGGGCARKPPRQIVSRVAGPEYLKPGEQLFYASTLTSGPNPYPVLVTAVDGRPIKIEGNPDDPVTRGGSNAMMQAALLCLYDPDRLRSPRKGNVEISWEQADKEITDALGAASSVVLLTRPTLGPGEIALVRDFQSAFDNVRHFAYDPVSDRSAAAAGRRIFGTEGRWRPNWQTARVVLSIDCDLFGRDGRDVENIRDWSESRTLEDDRHHDADLPRLYVAESVMSLTGSNADHRIGLKPSAMSAFVTALHKAIEGNASALDVFAKDHHVSAGTLHRLASDLKEHEGRACAVAGGHLPESVHAAVALLNNDLEAHGTALHFEPVDDRPPVAATADIARALEESPDVLICLGVNPVYDWPGGGFEKLLAKAKTTVGHGLHLHETLSACTFALPSHHDLESWNDARPRPDIESLCQPVIRPLFDSRQDMNSLLNWAGKPEPWCDYLREHWLARHAPGADEAHRKKIWEQALHDGVRVLDQAPSTPSVSRSEVEELARTAPVNAGYELVVLPHHAVHDGRFANNAWLHELPEPITKLVWDAAAVISPATAEELGVSEGDQIRVDTGRAEAVFPVLVQAGTADGVVATTLGYGRTKGGRIVLEAAGVNAAPLLAPDGSRCVALKRVEKVAGNYKLVRTQKTFSLTDTLTKQQRTIVLDGALEEYRHDPTFVQHKHHAHEKLSLYEDYDFSKGHKWAMAIDLNKCVGCSACVSACQAENNIASVGKEECSLGREMHWIRIDRYEETVGDELKIHHQPMTCQQCDNAPCENVCPVNATSHNLDGLNDMVYNRCVGTRYCANNCPYKVRRFNFLRYQDRRLDDPVQELAFNPRVTVRGVGVMEKCTFCIQRINAAKFESHNTGEPIPDGGVRTACQQACPAQAIVFGDLNDPNSAINAHRESGRAFHVLEELNVRPNVTYLARLRNPHPGAPTSGNKHEEDGHA